MAAIVLSIPAGGNLSGYLREIHKFPMLSAEEEIALARRWRDEHDSEAAHKLVTSHLRLVAKIAIGYRRYGLPMADLISEGTVGMMQALNRFDPERGFRLATYAIWLIRAAIQEYILHSWSLVRIGTTGTQKKLFFNLRWLKGRMQAVDDGDLDPEQVARIARMLDVPEPDVISMNRRLIGPDHSLNAPSGSEGEEEWQDRLMDETESQEAAMAERQEMDGRKALLAEALRLLKPRERAILFERWLKENPPTLEELAERHGISRERVRQIEVHAFEKLRETMTGQKPSRRGLSPMRKAAIADALWRRASAGSAMGGGTGSTPNSALSWTRPAEAGALR